MPPLRKLDIDKRNQSGYGPNAPTDQRNANSTHQTEGKLRHLTAELTGMHVKYKAALRQVIPKGIIRPAEAADQGPSTVNCIRSALDAQEDLVETTMADPGELASKGSPSAAAILGSSQPDVLDRTISNAIKCRTLKMGLSTVEAV